MYALASQQTRDSLNGSDFFFFNAHLLPMPPELQAASSSGEHRQPLFEECPAIVLYFLQSKCLVESERALRKELEQAGGWSEKSLPRNLWHSRLEKLIGAELPRRDDHNAAQAVDLTPRGRARRPSRVFWTPTKRTSRPAR